jgi:hypothetical protein
MTDIPDDLEQAPPVAELGGAIGRRATVACQQAQHDLCTGECDCRCHGRFWYDPSTEPCPHCGSNNVDRGFTGLDLCEDCGGLSRAGKTLRQASEPSTPDIRPQLVAQLIEQGIEPEAAEKLIDLGAEMGRQMRAEREASESSPDYAQLSQCAICGHIRNDHELIERQWCGRCASGGRSAEAWHTFTPAEP